MWLYGVALLLFGVLIPWRKGMDMLDPLLFLAYAGLAVVLTGPLALRLDPLRAILVGWGGGLITLGLAILTVNLTHQYGILLLPGRTLLAASVLLSLAGCVAIAGYSATVAHHTRNPRAMLRGLLLALLLAFLVAQRVFPDALSGWLTDQKLARLTWYGTPALLALSAGLFWWSRRGGSAAHR